MNYENENTQSISTGIEVIAADAAALRQQLNELKSTAEAVSKEFVTQNRAFYQHLAALYMWWREASSIEGFLEEQYATTERKFKSRVKHGINFAPLFWLTWGKDNDNGMTVDKAGRWSRVLNKLNDIFEAEEQYRTDTVAKLQGYIEENGGVDGLVLYGHSEKDADQHDDDVASDGDGDGDGSKAADTKKVMDERLLKVYNAANSFYSTGHSIVPVNLPSAIPLTADGLGLVLVRKVENGYQLIGSSTDESYVKAVTMDSYLQDFSVLPASIRTIIETISTQCLPRNLQRYYSALADDAAEGTAESSKKAIRCLMYRHGTGQFVLSPIRAKSGVVTHAKPYTPVLANAVADTFLPTRNLRTLESKLVAGRNFNLYAVSSKQVIPHYPGTTCTASHAVLLKSIVTKADHIPVEFWPYYESRNNNKSQLVTRGLKRGGGTWRAALPSEWFKKFAADFICKWINSHGNNIKRSHQRVFKLTFDQSALRVDFLYREGAFESNLAIYFDAAKVTGPSVQVHVLTKDFAVAMQSIADLGISSAAEVDVDENGISLHFATNAAEYAIYIPTCGIDGVRSKKHFTQYEPPTFELDESDTYIDPEEVGFEVEAV